MLCLPLFNLKDLFFIPKLSLKNYFFVFIFVYKLLKKISLKSLGKKKWNVFKIKDEKPNSRKV